MAGFLVPFMVSTFSCHGQLHTRRMYGSSYRKTSLLANVASYLLSELRWHCRSMGVTSFDKPVRCGIKFPITSVGLFQKSLCVCRIPPCFEETVTEGICVSVCIPLCEIEEKHSFLVQRLCCRYGGLLRANARDGNAQWALEASMPCCT